MKYLFTILVMHLSSAAMANTLVLDRAPIHSEIEAAWYKSKLEKSDCDSLSDYQQRDCLAEYDFQNYVRMSHYLEKMLRYQNTTSKKMPDVEMGDRQEKICKDPEYIAGFIDYFRNYLLAWNEFSYRGCELKSYQLRYGRGDGYGSSYFSSCQKEKYKLLNGSLEEYLGSGLSQEEITCTTPHGAYGKPFEMELHTKKYLVKINSGCDLGYYNCDKISYHGVRLSDGSSLDLTGGSYFVFDEHRKMDLQEGYIFSNGSTEYILTISGKLIVRLDGYIIYEDIGVWRGNPD